MAVQKSKKSRSRSAMRRSQTKLAQCEITSVDSNTGETHRRHHMTKDGYYRGKKILNTSVEKE